VTLPHVHLRTFGSLLASSCLENCEVRSASVVIIRNQLDGERLRASGTNIGVDKARTEGDGSDIWFFVGECSDPG